MREHHGPPLRIAYIMSRFPKVTETFIVHEAAELIRLGHDVQLYPLLREDDPVRHPEVERIADRVHYQPFISWPIFLTNLSLLVRSPRRYCRAVGRALSCTLGSANLFVGALGIFPKSVHFAREMQRAGVEHVHAHFATHPTLAAVIIHELTDIPFSFTAHGADIHVRQRGLRWKVEAASFAAMVSDYNRRFVMERCGLRKADKMPIVRCGIDASLFTPRDVDRSDRLRIICVASLGEVKGHVHLIEACRQLRDRGIPFTCHLIGEGPLRKDLTRLVASQQLEDDVVLHGALPQPRVIEMLQSGDVAILPSVQDPQGRREGVPVALMEAMACELPVVTSRLSGIPELVEDGVEGILTEPGDAGEIAEALARLAASPELRRSLGRAGRRKVMGAFDLRANAERLSGLIGAVHA